MAIEHSLRWLRPDAPYAPFVQVGLLSCLRGVDDAATVHWEAAEDDITLTCMLRTTQTLSEVADAIVAAPWPDLASLLDVDKVPQSIGSVLRADPEPIATWRQLTGDRQPATFACGSGLDAARRHVAALLTDGAINKDGALGRNRLVGGVKSDLSGFQQVKLVASDVALELADGPQWVSKTAGGTGLGLVPEVQTYGGTTGPKPDTVNESSALLYALITHALTALQPFAVLRGTHRIAGGRLWSSAGLRWQIHSTPRSLRALLGLYGDVIDGDRKPNRGVHAIYNSRPRPINTTISMFPWGERVA